MNEYANNYIALVCVILNELTVSVIFIWLILLSTLLQECQRFFLNGRRKSTQEFTIHFTMFSIIGEITPNRCIMVSVKRKWIWQFAIGKGREVKLKTSLKCYGWFEGGVDGYVVSVFLEYLSVFV